MASLKEIAVKSNKELAAALVRNLKAMPADRQTWSPLDCGRSALDQVQECAVINKWVAQIYRTREVPPLGGDAFKAEMSALDTLEKACAGLEAATEELCAAIQAFPEAELDSSVTLPWDTTTFAELFLVPYWNNSYHIGQISYIQTLYGDKEFH